MMEKHEERADFIIEERWRACRPRVGESGLRDWEDGTEREGEEGAAEARREEEEEPSPARATEGQLLDKREWELSRAYRTTAGRCRSPRATRRGRTARARHKPQSRSRPPRSSRSGLPDSRTGPCAGHTADKSGVRRLRVSGRKSVGRRGSARGGRSGRRGRR